MNETPAERRALEAGEPQVEIAGWGRALRVRARQLEPERLADVPDDVVLSRGLGRSYGDASLPPRPGARVVCTRRADRLLDFDAASGRLRAEAGLSLGTLQRLFLPRGWCVPVVPGTQFVTLGGMVAADVHGKSHHRDGSFGRHVHELRLRLADGRSVRCSEREEPELFRATLGGMGLTGHILEVELGLRRIASPWIYQRTDRFERLEDLLTGLREVGSQWPYTVGWMDTLSSGAAFGRGLVAQGRWAEADEAPPHPPRPPRHVRVPLDVPSAAASLLPFAGRVWNGLSFRFAKRPPGVVAPEPFFHPLDRLGDWNRVFGRRGFFQHQCVLPHDPNDRPARAVLHALRELPMRPHLVVVKDFGEEGSGLLSFPRPGITLALDFPCHPAHTQTVVDRLNGLVREHGGRIYLAKDAHTRRADFPALEPRAERFQNARASWDPKLSIRSALSVRLFGDAP